jgi:membrane protease YdiL (CAAX protease family)
VLNPYVNQREGRLRAFWRLLLQYGLYLYALSASSVVLTLAVGGGGFISQPALRAVSAVLSLVVTALSVWLVGRFVDKRPFAGFGMRLDRDWWLDLLIGLFLGALLMAGIFVTELSLGWVTVTGAFVAVGGGSFFPAILAPIVLFLCVGFYEELSSRGYQLTNVAEGLGFLGVRVAILLAVVTSASIFGILHVFNQNASLLSTTNIALAGTMFGVGYVLTGRLGVPVGMHIAWNFFQGNVFGFPVSGFDTIGATALRIEQSGPALWTGGAFGPEGGLLTTMTCVVGSLLIVLWVRVRWGKVKIETAIAEPPAAVARRTEKPAEARQA